MPAVYAAFGTGAFTFVGTVSGLIVGLVAEYQP
jgi:hypothetical protein